MSSEEKNIKCKFCQESMESRAVVCKQCRNWQSWKSFFYYPGNFTILISFVGAILAVLSAKFAWDKKIETEMLARNLIPMIRIAAQGTLVFGGIPDNYIEEIKKYQNKISGVIDPSMEEDIQKLLDRLNKENEKK